MIAAKTQKKVVCAKCSKPEVSSKCYGCQKDFCTQHTAEHIQELKQRLEEITNHRTEIAQSITTRTGDLSEHPLMKKIDQWEQTSTEEIHRRADITRTQLRNLLVENSANLSGILASMENELKQAAEDSTLVESRETAWKTKLDSVNKEFNEPNAILVTEDIPSITPFIKRISTVHLADTSFSHSAGNIHIKDNGRMIKQSLMPPPGSVRTIEKYSSECHLLRFNIENIETSPNKRWVFFGIISESAPVQSQSCTASTVYGWAGKDEIYSNGVKVVDTKNFQSDLMKNDVLDLIVDCDARQIRLINVRSTKQYELSVDEALCPFPWQVFVCLLYAHDQVRILT